MTKSLPKVGSAPELAGVANVAAHMAWPGQQDLPERSVRVFLPTQEVGKGRQVAWATGKGESEEGKITNKLTKFSSETLRKAPEFIKQDANRFYLGDGLNEVSPEKRKKKSDRPLTTSSGLSAVSSARSGQRRKLIVGLGAGNKRGNPEFLKKLNKLISVSGKPKVK